jgi:RNA polymerase sigma-70 factor, ECF subfamily
MGWDWGWARGVCLGEAQRVLGRSEAAEDAAQEAVLRAWRQHHCCRTPERPAPWLTTIARREALRAVTGGTEGPLEDGVLGHAPSPEADVVLRLDVHRVLGALAAGDRGLLAARYWDDLTQEQVAMRLDLPEGTVKVRLHRIRARLREMLDR